MQGPRKWRQRKEGRRITAGTPFAYPARGAIGSSGHAIGGLLWAAAFGLTAVGLAGVPWPGAVPPGAADSGRLAWVGMDQGLAYILPLDAYGYRVSLSANR